MTDELERLIADMRARNLADDATIDLIRKTGDLKSWRAAIDMYEVAPTVFRSLVATLAKSFNASTSPPKVDTSRKEVKTEMATINPTGKPASEPRPISKEELKALIPEWKKDATTFEPSPSLEFAVGEAYLVRLKKVFKGVYDAPLVVVSEFAPVDAEGNIGTVTKEDRKVPGFMVRRALQADVKLVPGLVYFMMLCGTRETQYGHDFQQGAVRLIGDKFPQ